MTTAMMQANQPLHYRVRGLSNRNGHPILVTGVGGDSTVFYFDTSRDFRSWRDSLPPKLRLKADVHVMHRQTGTAEFVEQGALTRMREMLRECWQRLLPHGEPRGQEPRH